MQTTDTIQRTPEQRGIIKSKASFVLVEAFAGTSKTFTLVDYALARPYEKMLYVAFNKAIQLEAAGKFPANVQCRTTHSLAYPYTGRKYQHKMGLLRPNDIMRFIHVPVLVASHVVNSIESFLASPDPALCLTHVPLDAPKDTRDTVLASARLVWDAMCDAQNPSVPMTHDGYLKLFQLSKPNLADKYKTILFDEYQDSNPCTADIYLSQTCKKVLVGDRHQSIYAFRGATNAFSMIKGEPERHSLTQSFRFGDGVAFVANQLLHTFKNETRTIVGCGAKKLTELKVDRTEPYAIICRTNAKVFAHAVALMKTQKVHFVGGIDNYPLSKLLDVYTVWSGGLGIVADPFFKTFTDFAALDTYAKQAHDKEILSLIGVVKEYKDDLPHLVQEVRNLACHDANQADVLVTTAHRSKGLEFKQVILNDDFDDLLDQNGEIKDMSSEDDQQEINMLYVAITRATDALELTPAIFSFLDAVKAKAAAAAAAAAAPAESERPLQADPFDAAATMLAGIQRGILRHGFLTAEQLGAHVGVPTEAMVRVLKELIRSGRLASSLFQKDRLVMEAVIFGE